MRDLRTDGDAMGQVVAFLVAGTIFLGSVGAILVATRNAAVDRESADDARQALEVQGLADLLVGSAGVGWASGPDAISRLGLALENGSGLDPSSLAALRGAMEESTANGKVDYADALASLGLDPDGSAGFHIRVYPVSLGEGSLEGLRVAYIGDWTSLASVKLPLPVGSTESMASKANVALNLTMFADAAKERQALRASGAAFNDRVYITTAAVTVLVDYPFPLPDLPLLPLLNVPLLEGDVYPDSKQYLDLVLAPRLSQYDVIVVGSGVDHSALVKNEIKDAIRSWVQAGGSLVVMGSNQGSTAWLTPLLNVGVSTVNGAPTAPDVAHPLLKEPNDLAWTSYNSFGQGWDIRQDVSVASYDDFSHIVIQEGKDVLAVSKQGAFGDGQVILTTYRAQEVAKTTGQAEANEFLENLLSYADRSYLYLDYGGTVPADRPVGLAVRQSWLWDDVYGQVPVRVEVLAWG